MVIVPNDSEMLQELAHPLCRSHFGPAGASLKRGGQRASAQVGGTALRACPGHSDPTLLGQGAGSRPGQAVQGGKQPWRSEDRASRDREVTVVSCAFIFGIRGLSADEATGNPRTRQACHYGLVGNNQ